MADPQESHFYATCATIPILVDIHRYPVHISVGKRVKQVDQTVRAYVGSQNFEGRWGPAPRGWGRG